MTKKLKDVKWKFMKYNGVLNRNYKVFKDGTIVHAKTGDTVKTYDMDKKSGKNGSDYQQVYIKGHKNLLRTHRIICETYHGKPTNGRYVVNHVDEFKNNNSIDNLQWVTPSENAKAYYANNEYVKYPRSTIIKVKRLLNKGKTNDQIAQEVKMSDSNVSAIKLGYIHTAVKPLTTQQRDLGNF